MRIRLGMNSYIIVRLVRRARQRLARKDVKENCQLKWTVIASRVELNEAILSPILGVFLHTGKSPLVQLCRKREIDAVAVLPSCFLALLLFSAVC